MPDCLMGLNFYFLRHEKTTHSQTGGYYGALDIDKAELRKRLNQMLRGSVDFVVV